MAKALDATGKDLFDENPLAWSAYLGLRAEGSIQVVDSDISTVSAAADKVYRVEGPEPHLLHLELQANWDSTLPRRVFRYNAILDLRHDLRVWSVVLLLRPEADSGNLTGILELQRYDGRRIVEFHYDVVRAWERPVAPLLPGALAVLPMAPLADVPLEEVPGIIQLIDARLMTEAPAAMASKIMEATLVLAGLRMDKDAIKELRGRLQSVNITTESSYYRLAVEEGLEKGLKEGLQQGLQQGKIEEARRLILSLGEIRFGPPDAKRRATIEAIAELERLERLSAQLLTAASWEELLGKV
jgi:predicted transposase YdaD